MTATAMKDKPKATPKTAKAQVEKPAKPVIPTATASTAVASKNDTPAIADMSTDVFSKEVLSELAKRHNAIQKAQNRIDTSFETIAFNLYWIYAKQAFKADGFDCIQDYANGYFGYSKTTCYSLIAVVERFAKRENGVMLEKLDESVKGYSVSKLSLMVNLTEDQLAALNPGMSVRDIKKFVKSLESKPLPELPEGDGDAGSEDEYVDAEDLAPDAPGTDKPVVDATAREITREVLYTAHGAADYKMADVYTAIMEAFEKNPDAVIEIALV